MEFNKFLKENEIDQKISSNSRDAHHLTVKKLEFKSKDSNESTETHHLASCGCDHITRIYRIKL